MKHPTGPTTYPADPQETADVAVRRILLHLLATIELNVPGVFDDQDPDCLHDLRVATRRTRSALGQLATVLPKKDTRFFRRRFRRLGTLTGDLRDFDVWLEGLDEEPYASFSWPDSGAEPLRRLILPHRDRSLAQVRHGLQAEKYRSLLERWRLYLAGETAPSDRAPEGRDPIGAVASQRIGKAYSRVLRHREVIGDPPSPNAVHRLRISAKKMRYLLEFFAGLFPRLSIRPVISDLKHLQDILGVANDLQVQLSWVRRLGRASVADRGTRLLLDRLEEMLSQSIRDRHAEVVQGAHRITGDEGRRRIRDLLGEEAGHRQPSRV